MAAMRSSSLRIVSNAGSTNCCSGGGETPALKIPALVSPFRAIGSNGTFFDRPH
jgi:hypothetical protein